jgi:hypothetical protein
MVQTVNVNSVFTKCHYPCLYYKLSPPKLHTYCHSHYELSPYILQTYTFRNINCHRPHNKLLPSEVQTVTDNLSLSTPFHHKKPLYTCNHPAVRGQNCHHSRYGQSPYRIYTNWQHAQKYKLSPSPLYKLSPSPCTNCQYVLSPLRISSPEWQGKIRPAAKI